MFKNRNLAAKDLAEKLSEEFTDEIDFVSGTTLGSLETAEVVGEELGAPVNHILSTKLFVPGMPDLVFGAVTYDGTIWLHDEIIDCFMVDRDFIADYAKRRRDDLQEKMEKQGIETQEDIESKNVLLVADGISSGMRVAASLGTCIKKNLGKKHVAAPFISKPGGERIEGLSDSIISLKRPKFVASVDDGYSMPEDKKIPKF